MQTSMELFMVELGLSFQQFDTPYKTYHELVTHSWLKTVWKKGLVTHSLLKTVWKKASILDSG